MDHTFTAAQVAEIIGAELKGSGEAKLDGISSIDRAGPRDLTFARDIKNARALAKTGAGAAIVTREALDAAGSPPCPMLVVADADAAVVKLLTVVAEALPKPDPGVHPSAVIDPDASVDPTASIGPGCSIGPGSSVGARTVLRANVVIEHGCSVGNDCILHPGVVIGADGFAYLPDPEPADPRQVHRKIPHVGGVEIGDFVEIGANTCIDRGKFAPTRVGPGTKIDNLVQIGHNCQIGACCILCAQIGLAGSVVMGDGAVLAGQVGVADNRNLGARCIVGAGSGVDRDIPAGEAWLGYPAMPGRDTYKLHVLQLRQLNARRSDPSGRWDKK